MISGTDWLASKKAISTIYTTLKKKNLKKREAEPEV